MKGHVLLYAPIVSLAIVLAGCTGGDTTDATSTTRPAEPSIAEGVATFDELLVGVLTLREGCVFLQGATGRTSAFLVWPAGYVIEEGQGTTVVLDDSGRTIAEVGDEVQVTGSIVSPTEPGLAVPEECDGRLWYARILSPVG